MLFNDPFRDQLAEPGRIAMTFLQFVENFSPFMDHFRLLGIFLVDGGINIPAVISETDLLSIQRHMKQARYRIRQLIAQIIHIVVDFHAVPCFPQNPDQRIPDTGVSKVPDMHGFVRVHACMLDNDFFPAARRQHKRLACPLLPIDVYIDEPRIGSFDPLHNPAHSS
ncbi:hypothetical protein D3C75_733370 [compost metagenome]